MTRIMGFAPYDPHTFVTLEIVGDDVIKGWKQIDGETVHTGSDKQSGFEPRAAMDLEVRETCSALRTNSIGDQAEATPIWSRE